jgi:hypothetical protein
MLSMLRRVLRGFSILRYPAQPALCTTVIGVMSFLSPAYAFQEKIPLAKRIEENWYGILRIEARRRHQISNRMARLRNG